jgi:hypothetical protein
MTHSTPWPGSRAEIAIDRKMLADLAVRDAGACAHRRGRSRQLIRPRAACRLTSHESPPRAGLAFDTLRLATLRVTASPVRGRSFTREVSRWSTRSSDSESARRPRT